MKVYLGTDHRGFELKEKLKAWLLKEGYDAEDLGALQYQKDDDYPIYSERLGKAVREEEGSKGVLFCGSGVGAVAAVNKIKGIRASVGLSSGQVKAGRHDDDMNVLVLAADFIEASFTREIVETFLNTPFDTSAERYQRRINQINKIEESEC